jgi:hypothetical protein
LKLTGENSIISPVAENEHLYIGNSGGQDEKGTILTVKIGAEVKITPPKGKLISNGIGWSSQDAEAGSPSTLGCNGPINILEVRGKLHSKITCKISTQQIRARLFSCSFIL